MVGKLVAFVGQPVRLILSPGTAAESPLGIVSGTLGRVPDLSEADQDDLWLSLSEDNGTGIFVRRRDFRGALQ